MGRNAKLKEQVTTIDFQARSVAALLHHPFRPILVGVDGRGTVKVYSHRHSAFVNSFHLADDKWPMSVVNMWQLNELQVHIHASVTGSHVCVWCMAARLRCSPPSCSDQQCELSAALCSSKAATLLVLSPLMRAAHIANASGPCAQLMDH